MDLTPGSVVANRYRASYRVGAGGMGEVWAGEHLTVGVKVAMKTLLVAAAAHHEVVARFKREAFLLGRVRSDHCARVLDFVEDPNHGLVLVMEFVEGESLADILDERCLTVEEAALLAVDLTTALCDLHRASVVHRDLKPGNLMMQPLPDGRTRAVLVDFGISRLLSSASARDEDTITGITKANMALGTVEYMAPEQILNSRDVTPVSDIYAVGAILYRSLVGRHAYGDKAEEELARAKLIDDAPPLTLDRTDRVAKGLQEVVRRAIRRRPADRYGSAREMLQELLPVRDLVKASSLDLDTTTADGHPLGAALAGGAETAGSAAAARSAESAPAGAPAALASSGGPPPGALPSGALASSAGPTIPSPRRRASTLVAALAAAFAVGAAAAAAVLPRGLDDAARAQEARVTPPLEAPRVEPAAAPAITAAASAPAAAEEPAPRTIDLDEPAPGEVAAGKGALPASSGAWAPPGGGTAVALTAGKPPAVWPPIPKSAAPVVEAGSPPVAGGGPIGSPANAPIETTVYAEPDGALKVP